MNLSELAKEMDLSVATVSRVLAGISEKYRISAKTRERVMEAAEKFGVVADPLGSSLRTGKTRMVGLVVPDITNPYFSGMARAVELLLRERGIAVMLSDSNEDAATELGLIRAMRGRRLDGMILASVGKGSEALGDLVCGSGMKVVLLDRVLPGLEGKVSMVSLDNYQAGKLAAERLVAAGHQHIGCLRGSADSHSDCERVRGVVETLGERGIYLRVAGGAYDAKEALAGARKMLTGTPPTAVVTLTGQGVLGMLQAANESGLHIPSQLSLVAFDEQPWSSFLETPLTTVVQPVDAMAARAVELLLDNCSPISDSFHASLRERDSVKDR